MILCIETATPLCSVALCDKDGVAGLRENAEGRSHAVLLTLFIEELLKEKGLETTDLEAVAVSKGPGSYTGLRIGVSVAKGICFASSIPLIGLDTTMSMCSGFLSEAKDKYKISHDDILCPVLDARRMEIYNALYDSKGNMIRETRAEIIGPDSFMELPESSAVYIFGEGAAKCRDVTGRKNIVVDEEFRISASYMRKPAWNALKGRRFEDVAYFEPFYLKDFLTTKQVKNILNK